jgi:hypothetical protein
MFLFGNLKLQKLSDHKMKREISLTPEQADLCQAALSRDLVRVLSLLACKKDEVGEDLTTETQRELMGLSSRLQLMLLNFGMTSEELERIVKGYNMDPEY